MSCCEAHLTRILSISFIDARSLLSDAKLRKGIHGYHSQDQQAVLIAESLTIFSDMPEQTKKMMRDKYEQLGGEKEIAENTIVVSRSSDSLAESVISTSNHSDALNVSQHSEGGQSAVSWLSGSTTRSARSTLSTLPRKFIPKRSKSAASVSCKLEKPKKKVDPSKEYRRMYYEAILKQQME